MFVAVYSGTHVVGGSSIGCKFLRESGSYIPSSFLGYVSSAISGICIRIYTYICVDIYIYIYYIVCAHV